MELKIEYVTLDSLRPYEKNARSHGKDDLKAIIASIQDFGFNDPIGVWHDIIVEGHGRWLAAKELKMEQVPVIRLDELSDEQRKAYALAHNKTAELSGWDFDVLAAELKDISEFDMSQFGFDMAAVGEEDAEVEDDNFVEELPKQATTRLGDIFKLGGALPHLRRFNGSGDNKEAHARAAGGPFTDRPALQRGLCRKDKRCAQDRERQKNRQRLPQAISGCIQGSRPGHETGSCLLYLACRFRRFQF